MSRNNLEPEIVSRILELERDGLGIKAIAADVGIDRKTVYKYISLNRPDREYIPHIPITEEEAATVRQLYLTEGYTPTDIAWKMDVSLERVRRIIKKYGMKKPIHGENQNDPFKVKLPDPINDPVFYPERKIHKKIVKINGKQYQDISEVYGL